MTQAYTGPSWNEMANACTQGREMELKPIDGGPVMKFQPTSAPNSFRPNRQFHVRGTVNGRMIEVTGTAPSSIALATYRMV